ncbi:MAG TPA: DUF4446 family protein [Patescibacteria group bacterium]
MTLTFYFIVAIGIWLSAITFFLTRMLLHYRRLTADVAKKDLISSLNHLISVTEQNSDDIKGLSEKLLQNIEDNKNHLQRIGFMRYNPFTDTGGDQSFSMCLLDEKGNGIMVSSLHSRENTRLYAKKIENGKPQAQVLSKEEQEVIKQALK